MSRHWKSLAAVPVLFFVAGCSESTSPMPPVSKQSQETSRPTATESEGPKPNSAAQSDAKSGGSSISNEEAETLGHRLEEAVRDEDTSAFVALFDVERFGVSAGAIPLASSEREAPPETEIFLQHVDDFVHKGLRMAIENVASRAFRNGSFFFVGVRNRQQIKCLLFRSVNPQKSVTYHEIAIERRGTSVVATDFDLYTTADWLSATLAQANKGIDTLPVPKPGELPPLSPEMARLDEIIRAIQDENSSRADELYRALPADEKAKREPLLLLLVASHQLDESAFQSAVNACQRSLPRDVQFNLTLGGIFDERKRWDEAIEALKQAESGIGGDHYLGVWRANLLVEAGKPNAAKSVIEQIIKQPLTDWQSAWGVVTFCNQTNDFPQAIAMLDKIQPAFGTELVEFGLRQGYDDLLASPEFRRWKAEGRPVSE